MVQAFNERVIQANNDVVCVLVLQMHFNSVDGDVWKDKLDGGDRTTL
jgi:hypothetical protein